MNFRKHMSQPLPMGDCEIIVLTHTEVGKDNRIRKTINALLRLEGVKVFAVGVEAPASEISGSAQGIPNLRVQNLGTGNRFRSRRAGYDLRGSWETGSKAFKVMRLSGKFRTIVSLNFSLVFAVLRGTDRAKIRVIYCNDEQSLLAASVLAVVTQSNLIYDAHELEHERNGHSKLARTSVLLWEKFFWPCVDYFITVSDSIRLHYLKTLGPKPTAVVLNSPYASGDPQQSPSMGDVRGVLGLGPQDTILLYAGALSEGRGIRLLLECAKKLPPNHHLVFLGRGPMFREIAGYSEALDHVHVLSPVPPDRVVDFISTADIGLCLLEASSISYQYALPNKFFDYAFAGLPILYSDFPEMSKVGEAYALGEKCENSSRSILQAIARLKGTRTARSSLGPLSWEYQAEVIRGVVKPFLPDRS